MKIFMFCDFFGLDQQYQENLLTNYYLKQGHTVTVLTSTFKSVFDYTQNNYDANAPEVIEQFGALKVIRKRYALNILHKITKFSGVYQLLKEEEPDLIFVHDIQFNIHDAVRYLKNGGKSHLIMDYHADYSNSAKNWLSLNILHKVIRKSYFKLYRKYIEKIYPIVPESAVFLNEVYGVPLNEMELLPLGCDYDASNEIRSKYNKADLRAQLGIPLDAFVVFTGGKLNKAKRTDVLIDALKELNKEDIHLVIAGEVPQNEKEYGQTLRQKAEGLHVKFGGWMNAEEIYKFMLVADIAVFPASQSVMWQQSIGMHLPVILGNEGRQDPSYLNYANNVICLSPAQIQPAYLASKINQLYSDQTLLDQMVKGAQKTAIEFLSYDKISKKTLETSLEI